MLVIESEQGSMSNMWATIPMTEHSDPPFFDFDCFRNWYDIFCLLSDFPKCSQC